MVESLKEIISDEAKLNEIFGADDIKGGTIADKLEMPRPGDEGVVVRFLYTKGRDGSLGVINVVKNEKFKDGSGEFLTVEKYDNPGVEYQVGLGKSIKNAIVRMNNSNGWKLTDLPGKIGHITANYYPKIKCNKCNGRGCPACENTGNSTVFNVRARLDLMSTTKNVKRTDEF